MVSLGTNMSGTIPPPPYTILPLAVRKILLLSTLMLQQYVYTYVDINRDQLKNVKTVKQLMGMMPSDDALTYDFVCYARDNGVPMRWYYINLSRSLIARQLRALVIRDVLGSEEFYRYYNRTDTAQHGLKYRQSDNIRIGSKKFFVVCACSHSDTSFRKVCCQWQRNTLQCICDK